MFNKHDLKNSLRRNMDLMMKAKDTMAGQRFVLKMVEDAKKIAELKKRKDD